MRLWDAVSAAAGGVEDDGSYDAPKSPDNCAARRAAAFRVTAKDLGLPADEDDKPFGVIIESQGPGGLSTLAAYANGDASLLHEDGSGIISRPSHVHVVKQAKRLVACAADLTSLVSPIPAPSEPAPGTMRFYFLTESLVSAEVARDLVRSGASPWSPLLEVADELISELSQYLLGDLAPPARPTLIDYAKSVGLVAITGGVTYAASLIQIPWVRWPLVGLGLFFTAAALFVFYAMLAGSGDGSDEGEPTTGR